MSASKHRIGDAEYAAALAAGRAEAETEVRAGSVRYVPEREAVEIVTTRGAGFLIPRTWIGALDEVPAEELAGLSVWPDGSAIELEARDIQVSVHGLLTAVLPAMLPGRALASVFAARGGRSTSPAKRRTARANGRRGGRRPLQAEIVEVLRERRTGMSTRALADAIQRRGRYRRRNGTAVTASQVAARVSRYPQLFERRGSQVRLKSR
jgi:hypothetical protein